MRYLILILIILICQESTSQNALIEKERYNVIEALFKDRKGNKRGKVILDRNFFPFLGLFLMISDPDFMDKNLMGHCLDMEKKIVYSFSEILSKKNLDEMDDQISYYPYYRRIDPAKVPRKIKLINDKRNERHAISLPLISGNKAVVYYTNKNNEASILVFEKIEGKWIRRCNKQVYLRFDHPVINDRKFNLP